MRKIERPMSTSHVMEFLFHEIKDEEEAKNIMASVQNKDDLVIFSRSVDPETFQPWIFFGFRNPNQPVAMWFKYCSPLVLVPSIIEVK